MLRIDEAIEFAARQGRKILKKDLAAKIWPEHREEVRRVKMSNLQNASRVGKREIEIICRETGVTAGFLLGLEHEDDD